MTTDVTGLEAITPVKIKDTSATERAAFRRCRRSWFLGVVHRLQSVEGNQNFWLGTLVHSGLEVYYGTLMRGNFDVRMTHADRRALHDTAASNGLDQYQDEYDNSMKALKEELSFIWPNVEQTYRDVGFMGFEMLQGYFEREFEFPLFDQVVDVERRVFVPIRSPKGRTVGKLSVRTDAVGYRHGSLAVADHKTAGREMAAGMLELDDQLTAEVYAVWKERGEFPEEAVYNQLMKKLALPPKRNKDDKRGVPQLSKDKSQPTTYELYREEIARLGLDVEDYADVLYHFRDQDVTESKFFKREAVMRSPAQMVAFEANLYEEFRDMKAVAAHPERAYPNPTQMNCTTCPVKIICTTIQDDGDVPAIISAGYVVGDPRR